jgi:tetratricopeptide (TPR) repeat protein
MEFNKRQSELNRIQAIAQMLPHISNSSSKDGKTPGDEMAKDGAIWAIFRAADNKTMLRDLAALFPQEIYHVVSSIANSGELDHDSDAVCALEVASEKLANKYSSDPKKTELAGRLFAQALKLRQRQPDDSTTLRVVDVSSSAQEETSSASDDSVERLIKSMNNLADEHLVEKELPKTGTSGKKKSGDAQWEAIELYQRARKVGAGNNDPQVQEQLARADLSLATIYLNQKQPDDAFKYLKEAIGYMNNVTSKKQEVKALDKDGDGFIALPEIGEAVKQAQERYKQMMIDFPDKGAEVND